MHMLREQSDQSYRGQVSQMVVPVQESVKPVQPSSYRVGVDPQEMSPLVEKIHEMLAGEKTMTLPLSDPRVVALMPQLSRAKMRVELACHYRLLTFLSPSNYTIVFQAN